MDRGILQMAGLLKWFLLNGILKLTVNGVRASASAIEEAEHIRHPGIECRFSLKKHHH
jgi:hypothetical protein